MTELLHRTLQSWLDDNVLVDIWRDRIDDDESITGIPFQISDKFIALHRVSDQHEFDGVTVLAIDDVTRVRRDSAALESIAQLMRGKSRPKLPAFRLEYWMDIALSVHDAFGHVAAHTAEHCFIGFVLDHDHQWLLLDEVATLARRDRSQLILDIDAVNRVDADDAYTRSVVRLANERKTDSLTS